MSLTLKGDIHITAHGDKIVYEQKGIDIDQNYLSSLFDSLIYLIETYPSVVALGGEAIEPLIKANHILPAIAPQLIQDIARNTQKRIEEDSSSYICPRCLGRCTVHKARQQVKYYGCRVCHQSRNVIKWEKPVTVVLDNTEETVSRDGMMRENWITGQRLFDFDEVEILQATDEEVEWFAIQVGNDMDVERKSRQTQIRCRVSAACEISENTLRILKNMFGKIEVGAILSGGEIVVKYGKIEAEEQKEIGSSREESYLDAGSGTIDRRIVGLGRGERSAGLRRDRRRDINDTGKVWARDA